MLMRQKCPLRPIRCKASSPASEGVLIRAGSSLWLVLQSALNQMRPAHCPITAWLRKTGTINLIRYLRREKEGGHVSSGKSLFMTAGTHLHPRAVKK